MIIVRVVITLFWTTSINPTSALNCVLTPKNAFSDFWNS